MKQIGCPVCSNPLSVRAAEGRKSGKPFIMLVCDKDPRHFRGFITHQEYVRSVLDRTSKKDGLKTQSKGRGRGTADDDSRPI
jgi:hypothetical protein